MSYIENRECPTCAFEGPFVIRISVLAEISEDSIDNFCNASWGEGTFAKCENCNYHGIWKDFQKRTRSYSTK